MIGLDRRTRSSSPLFPSLAELPARLPQLLGVLRESFNSTESAAAAAAAVAAASEALLVDGCTKALIFEGGISFMARQFLQCLDGVHPRRNPMHRAQPFTALRALLWPSSGPNVPGPAYLHSLSIVLIQHYLDEGGSGEERRSVVAAACQDLGTDLEDERSYETVKEWARGLTADSGASGLAPVQALCCFLGVQVYVLELLVNNCVVHKLSPPSGVAPLLAVCLAVVEKNMVKCYHPVGIVRTRPVPPAPPSAASSEPLSKSITVNGVSYLVSEVAAMPNSCIAEGPGKRVRAVAGGKAVWEEFHLSELRWLEAQRLTQPRKRRQVQVQAATLHAPPVARSWIEASDAGDQKRMLQLLKPCLSAKINSTLARLTADGVKEGDPGVMGEIFCRLMAAKRGIDKISNPQEVYKVILCGPESASKTTLANCIINVNCPPPESLRASLQEQGLADARLPRLLDAAARRNLLDALDCSFVVDQEEAEAANEKLFDYSQLGLSKEQVKGLQHDLLNQSQFTSAKSRYNFLMNRKPGEDFFYALTNGSSAVGLTHVVANVTMGPSVSDFAIDMEFEGPVEVSRLLDSFRRQVQAGEEVDAASLAKIAGLTGLSEEELEEEELELQRLVLPPWCRPYLGKRVQWTSGPTSDRAAALRAVEFLSLAFTVNCPSRGLLKRLSYRFPGERRLALCDTPGMAASAGSCIQNQGTLDLLALTAQKCVEGKEQSTLVVLTRDRNVPKDVTTALQANNVLSTIAQHPGAFRIVPLQCIDGPNSNVQTPSSLADLATIFERTEEMNMKGYYKKILKDELTALKKINVPSEQIKALTKKLEEAFPQLVQPLLVDAFGEKLNEVEAATEGEQQELRRHRESLSMQALLDKLTAPIDDGEAADSYLLVLLAGLLDEVAPLALALTSPTDERDRATMTAMSRTLSLSASQEATGLRASSLHGFRQTFSAACSDAVASCRGCVDAGLVGDFSRYKEKGSKSLGKDLGAERPSCTDVPKLVIKPVFSLLAKRQASLISQFLEAEADAASQLSRDKLHADVSASSPSMTVRHMAVFVERSMRNDFQLENQAVLRGAREVRLQTMIAQECDKQAHALQEIKQERNNAKKLERLRGMEQPWAERVVKALETSGFKALVRDAFNELKVVRDIIIKKSYKVLQNLDREALRKTEFATSMMATVYEMAYIAKVLSLQWGALMDGALAVLRAKSGIEGVEQRVLAQVREVYSNTHLQNAYLMSTEGHGEGLGGLLDQEDHKDLVRIKSASSNSYDIDDEMADLAQASAEPAAAAAAAAAAAVPEARPAQAADAAGPSGTEPPRRVPPPGRSQAGDPCQRCGRRDIVASYPTSASTSMQLCRFCRSYYTRCRSKSLQPQPKRHRPS